GNDRGAKGTQEGGRMQDRMTEDKPTRVPARANRWWNQPSAIGLGGTEGLTGVLGDRAKSVLLLERAPTDWKAGCGRSARPVWEGGGAHRAPPILIHAKRVRRLWRRTRRQTPGEGPASHP